MSLDYTKLTTRAQCDEATAEVDYRLLTFTTRDANTTLADTRTTRTKTSASAQLDEVNGEILSAESILALPTTSAKTREAKTDELEALRLQKKRLEKRTRLDTGFDAFIDDVNEEQNDTLTTLLTTIKAGFAQRRDELSE